MNEPARLALALRHLDGVGRVTSRKMLRAFGSYEQLQACPLEQLLHRMKGTPNARTIAEKMRSGDVMAIHLNEAESKLDALQKKGVHVLTLCHEAWPAGIRELPRKYQPDVLYAYGPVASLAKKRIAFFGAESIEGEPFETAQSLIKPLSDKELLPVAACQHGFDVVIHKRASSFRTSGSIMIAHAGLSRVPTSFRPVASASVRNGGVLLSPFDMDHGPFKHDEMERAYLQAAIADACLYFAAPNDSPEHHALEWTSKSGKPVFAWKDISTVELSEVREMNPDHLLTQITAALPA